MRTVVISLGGSLVNPEAGKADTAFLKKFRAVILKYVKRGQRFAIIVGGGKLARGWQEALRQAQGISSERSTFDKLSVNYAKSKTLREDLDWVGIRATQLNAELVRAMFGNFAHSKLVSNPAQKVGQFKIVVGAGYLPGHSTDYDSVVRAKTLGAKTVINLSNVQYVYNKDPDKYKDAKPLKNISWKQFFKIIGVKFRPGMHSPFDPTAAKAAARARIKVVFMNGRDLKNVERFLQGKKFSGTIIG